MKTKIDLTDKLTLEKVPKLTLDECIILARAVKPENWKRTKGVKSFTEYVNKFYETDSGEPNILYGISITNWHSGKQNVIPWGGYELNVSYSLNTLGKYIEKYSERKGKIEILFEDIKNYKQNVDTNKALKKVREFIQAKKPK